MLEEKEANSWKDFVDVIEDVKRRYGSYTIDVGDGKTFINDKVRILFRGQANSEWSLDTTLERKTDESFSVQQYLHAATINSTEIESFTDYDWKIPEFPKLNELITEKQDAFRVHLPCYDYLVYLRHHGFPSPLLDWTESPYIAAYFAYLDATKSDPAVYCFIERAGPTKGGVGGQPQISLQGPYVKTHKRHFAQKAWYTISTKWDSNNETHCFVPHETVFDLNYEKQDVLIKIKLPKSIREMALKQMNEYNINHFTLFQSEDSLIKSLGVKQFDL